MTMVEEKTKEAARALLQQHHAAQEAAEQQRKAEQAQQQQERLATLERLLKRDLGGHYESFGFTYETVEDRGYVYGRARCMAEGTAILVSADNHYIAQPDNAGADYAGWYVYIDRLLFNGKSERRASRETLHEVLLFSLALLLQDIERDRKIAAIRERGAQEQARREAEEEAAYRARLAASRAEHEACCGMICSAIREQGAWIWPEGKRLTLYRLRWYVGVDREGRPQFDEGWATQQVEPDNDGYYRLIEADRRGNARRVAPVRTDTLVWERFDYAAAHLLPSWAHTREQRYEVPGIESEYVHGQRQHLYHRTGDDRAIRVAVELPIPIAWIRSVIGDAWLHDIPEDAIRIIRIPDDDDRPF
jgi:hypothetical protein